MKIYAQLPKNNSYKIVSNDNDSILVSPPGMFITPLELITTNTLNVNVETSLLPFSCAAVHLACE